MTAPIDAARSREEFVRRFAERFNDPAFDAYRAEIEAVLDAAWTTYQGYHQSPPKGAGRYGP